MTVSILYAIVGISLFCLGMFSFIVHEHIMRKILAFNIMGSGVFMVLISLAKHTLTGEVDPVPHAMVITGIVVSVSATALALTLMLQIKANNSNSKLEEHEIDRIEL